MTEVVRLLAGWSGFLHFIKSPVFILSSRLPVIVARRLHPLTFHSFNLLPLFQGRLH
jgi:hypothetical protein